MTVEIAESEASQGRLEYETDHVRTEVELEAADIEQLHTRLTNVLNDGDTRDHGDPIMVERRHGESRPFFVQITRGDVAVPMFLTEKEVGSLTEDARELLSAGAGK